MRTTRGILLLLLLAALSPNGPGLTLSFGQNQGAGQAKVAGRVRDSEGRPISRAQVTITATNGQSVVTATDESGVFGFTGTEGASYQITFKAGDKSGGAIATIRSGRLTPQEFTLR